MTRPLPAGPTRIRCCVCLNLEAEPVDATNIVSGYAVCSGHVDLLTGDFTDFAGLIRRLKARHLGDPA